MTHRGLGPGNPGLWALETQSKCRAKCLFQAAPLKGFVLSFGGLIYYQGINIPDHLQDAFSSFSSSDGSNKNTIIPGICCKREAHLPHTSCRGDPAGPLPYIPPLSFCRAKSHVYKDAPNHGRQIKGRTLTMQCVHSAGNGSSQHFTKVSSSGRSHPTRVLQHHAGSRHPPC